jgi:uncharacterized protein (UPF0332 family)
LSKKFLDRANKELERAKKALKSSRILLDSGLFEDSISRAYYSVLHAAKAALSIKGIDTDTHEGVRRMFGLHLVKKGEIAKEFARILIAEQEDREIGDYAIGIEIPKDRAAKRVDEAEKFLSEIEKFINNFLNEEK